MTYLFPPVYNCSIESPISKIHATCYPLFFRIWQFFREINLTIFFFFAEFVNVTSQFVNLTVILTKKWWMSITMLFAKMAKFARKHVKNIKPFIELCTEPHINVLPMRSNRIYNKKR